MPRFKESVATLVPPLLWRGARKVVSCMTGRDIRFIEGFESWKQAEAASKGYGAENILAHTVESARKVKNGDAAFERDGVAFAKMEHHFPLAWALMRATAITGRLHVLDFGGGLGSTYYQLRNLL